MAYLEKEEFERLILFSKLCFPFFEHYKEAHFTIERDSSGALTNYLVSDGKKNKTDKKNLYGFHLDGFLRPHLEDNYLLYPIYELPLEVIGTKCLNADKEKIDLLISTGDLKKFNSSLENFEVEIIAIHNPLLNKQQYHCNPYSYSLALNTMQEIRQTLKEDPEFSNIRKI
jgi:hypothetical protein